MDGVDGVEAGEAFALDVAGGGEGAGAGAARYDRVGGEGAGLLLRHFDRAALLRQGRPPLRSRR